METDYMDMRYVAVTRLLSFYALFMVAGALTRSAIQLFLKCDDMFKQPMEDVVAAFEVYGCNIGHIYVFQIYGLSTHLVVLLIVGAFHAYFLKGITANPLTQVLQYWMNCCPLDTTFAKILAMVVGGLVGHFTAIACWPVLMAEFDREILAEMHCVAASTSVPVIVSLGVEFLGAFLICVLVLNTTLSSSVDAFEPPMKFLITGLLSGTGMYANSVYLNPVVASRRLIGRDGNDFFLHLVNYWVAPIAGAAVAVSFTEFTSNNSDSACLPDSKACVELKSDCDLSNNSDLACVPFCECQTSGLQSSESCVDSESDCDFSHNSDLACVPFRERQTSGLQSSTACAELKSDFNPKLPRLRNRFHQAPPRSRTLVSKVQMPPIYVSRTEEEMEEEDEEAVEDEDCDNEVMYSCGKASGVNALNHDEPAAKTVSYRRCTEQPIDDTCGRGFPGSNAAWQSSTVTSNRACGMHSYCTPISCTGQTPYTNQPPCADTCTASDCCTTVAYRCCCYMESLSCSCHRSAVPMPLCGASVYCGSSTCDKTDDTTSAFCPSNDANAELQPASEKCPRSSLVPTQSESIYPEDRGCTVCGESDCVCSRPETGTQCKRETTAGAPLTCQRSQRTTFKQPLRDNSQIQTTDSAENLARPSVHKMEVLCKPRESKPRESTPRESKPRESIPCEYKPRESTPCEYKPCESTPCESTPREYKPCESTPRESKPCESTPRECKPRESTPRESKPRESKPCESKPRESAPQADEQPLQEESMPPPSPTPSVRGSTLAEVPKTSSHCVPTCHRDVSKGRSKPSHKSPYCTRPKSSNRHHRKSPCHKKRKHSKPSQTCPSCRHRSSSRCGACTTSHLDRTKPNPTPSHSNSRKLSPSGANHRAPSCQRSRNTSRRRASVKRSKPFPTGPESCMF